MFPSSPRPLTLVALTAACAGCIGPHAMTKDPRARACPGMTTGAAAQAVDWYRPADRGDRRRMERWCAAAGPVVLDTVPAKPAAGPAGPELRLLVWNVSAGGGDLRAFLETEAGVVCGSGASRAAPPFVLLAQEAFRRSHDVPPVGPGVEVSAPAAESERASAREDVVAVSQRCGLALFYVPAVRNGDAAFADGREDRGNAIVANVPLHDPIAIELPAEDSRRLAIGATVRHASGDSVRVVSLHFTLLPKLWRNLTTGNAARVRQALGLLDALDSVEAERGTGIATVVAGDANTWSDGDAALRRLRRAFPDSPEPLGVGTRGPFPADHLLFRRGAGPAGGTIDPATYRRLDDPYNSDHYPLAAVYRHPS